MEENFDDCSDIFSLIFPKNKTSRICTNMYEYVRTSE